MGYVNSPEQIQATIARNHLRKGKPLVSEKALAAVRSACKKMNEARHLKAGHILSNVDSIALTADCNKCGRVPIKVMKHRANGDLRDQYLCWVGTLNRKDRVGADARVLYSNQALDMWENQQGNCAICNKPMERAGNTSLGATLDHCHKTGLLRGFLHQGCNKGLGHFFDDPLTLRKAAEYLEQSGHAVEPVTT
ncbi:MAG: endonuclease domain-containing protein [Halobacteriota archaeon]|jgi:hypothetical protein